MIIEIDKVSTVPIYIQLIKQLKKAIILGHLDQDDSLPSVRSLAGDLGVNMHTVNKAYNMLVDENILSKSQQGYVVNPTEIATDEVEHSVKDRLEDILVDIYIHDLPVDKVKGWIDTMAEDLKREW